MARGFWARADWHSAGQKVSVSDCLYEEVFCVSDLKSARRGEDLVSVIKSNLIQPTSAEERLGGTSR